MTNEKPASESHLKPILDFIYQIAKDRPEWVGKYFKYHNESFDPERVDEVDINSFNPNSRWLRPKNKKKFPYFIINKECFGNEFYERRTPEIKCTEMDSDFQDWLKRYKDSHFQDPPKRWEVFKYLIDRYGKTHHFPGIDYLKYLSESKRLVPTNNLEYQYYFLPGCLFYDKDGILDLLTVSNHGTYTREQFFDLNGIWGPSNEVILFKK